jgi:hypothetical protein
VEYKRASITSGRSNSKRCSASLRVDANDVNEVSQGTLDVSALLAILFRPALSVSEWAVHGSTVVGGVPVSGGIGVLQYRVLRAFKKAGLS